MNLDLNRITEKISKNDFIKNFIKELEDTLENFNSKNEVKDERMENTELTIEEEKEFYRQEAKFLQDYFKKELQDMSKGEIFIVTNKYENDVQYHRYKVAQYKNNMECKYIAFESDLPENVQIGDVVRKINEKYIYCGKETEYVKSCINKIKEDIIDKRN